MDLFCLGVKVEKSNVWDLSSYDIDFSNVTPDFNRISEEHFQYSKEYPNFCFCIVKLTIDYLSPKDRW